MALKKFQGIGSEHQKPIEVVNNTCIIGRKRIIVPNRVENNSNVPFLLRTPSSKRRGRRMQSERTSRLDLLPQDLLVRILCKVNHDDLKQLLLVSKSVNETTLIAKETHFAYTTPRTKAVFTKDDDLDLNDGLIDGREVPNAPMQRRVAKLRLDFEKFAGIAVDLFPSFETEWPNNELAGLK